MGFRNPHLLFLMVLLIPAAYYVYREHKKSKHILKKFNEDDSHIAGRLVVKLVLSILLLASLLIVAAGPQHYITTANARKSGRFVFLADVSRSMAARPTCADQMPIDREKTIISNILTGIPTAKFALMAFSKLVFPFTELTFDKDYLLKVIENGIYIESVPSPGSDIANALLVIAEKKTKKPEMYADVEYVVLISDGDISDKVRQELDSAISVIKSAKIHVISVGVGPLSDTPIPTLDDKRRCISGQFERANGKEFFTHLFDAPLKKIAEETGGRYFSESQQDMLMNYLKSKLTIDPGLQPPTKTQDLSADFLIVATIAVLGLAWVHYY